MTFEVTIDFWGHFVDIPIKKNIKKTSTRLDLIRNYVTFLRRLKSSHVETYLRAKIM